MSVKHALRGRLLVASMALLVSTASHAGDEITVSELHLRMDNTDAAVLVRKDPYDVSSFAVALDENGPPLKGRIKVLGSSSRTMAKRSFFIKLDKGGQWHGQSRISLNSMASDPSLMRNWLVWEIYYALGMVGPAVHYRNLYLNERLQGIYLDIEWIEEAMFARQGLGAAGQLFHPLDSRFCGDLDKSRRNELEECWVKLSPADDDFAPLQQLIDDIDATPIGDFDKFLEKSFDVESVINWLAVNVLTGNGDTYNKNYFLYRSLLTDKWTVIPWDYDLTFGRTYDPFLAYPHSVYNDYIQYFYPPELGAYSPLKEKVLRNPVLLEKFRARLGHLLGLHQQHGVGGFALFTPQALSERITALKLALLPALQKDPLLRDEQERFHQNVAALQHFVVARHGYLKTAIYGSEPWDPQRAYWHPELSPPPLPYPAHLAATAQGIDSVAVSAEGYGYLLAEVRSEERRGETLVLSAEGMLAQPPALLPEGLGSASCIERSWRVQLNSPDKVRGVLTLEYLQENSRRHELGNIANEERLKLWRHDGRDWQELPTQVNPLANTLTTSAQVLVPRQPINFVACTTARRGAPGE